MTERARLLERYRQLVLRDLPQRALAERWVVVADHCFGRIVLDNAVGGCWYDVLGRARGPAFLRLDDEALARAVGLAEQVAVHGDPLLRQLNDHSLAWRGNTRPAACSPAPRARRPAPTPAAAAAPAPAPAPAPSVGSW